VVYAHCCPYPLARRVTSARFGPPGRRFLGRAEGNEVPLPPMDDLWRGAPTIHRPRYNPTHDLEAVQHGRGPHVLHVAPHPAPNDLSSVSVIFPAGITPGTAGTVDYTRMPGATHECPDAHPRASENKRDRPQAVSLAASPTGWSTHHRHAFECVVGRPLEESR